MVVVGLRRVAMRYGACIVSGTSTVADDASPRMLENLKSFSIGALAPIACHAGAYGQRHRDDRVRPPALH